MSHEPSESNRGHASVNPVAGTLLVSETFVSRQGEGKLTGTESFFIRTSGCNLRCWFCDTPYASWNPRGELLGVDSLLGQIRASGVGHVVLTGGEPLLPVHVKELAEVIMGNGFHLTIETAGTINRPLRCDLLSLSPKLADSTPDVKEHPIWNRLHNERRMPLDVMKRLIDAAVDFQLKFVVGDREHFEELHGVVDSLQVEHDDVFIMPRAVTIAELDAAAKWLRPWAESAGYRYCDRMQIRWFGNRRGT